MPVDYTRYLRATDNIQPSHYLNQVFVGLLSIVNASEMKDTFVRSETGVNYDITSIKAKDKELENNLGEASIDDLAKIAVMSLIFYHFREGKIKIYIKDTTGVYYSLPNDAFYNSFVQDHESFGYPLSPNALRAPSFMFDNSRAHKGDLDIRYEDLHEATLFMTQQDLDVLEYQIKLKLSDPETTQIEQGLVYCEWLRGFDQKPSLSYGETLYWIAFRNKERVQSAVQSFDNFKNMGASYIQGILGMRLMPSDAPLHEDYCEKLDTALLNGQVIAKGLLNDQGSVLTIPKDDWAVIELKDGGHGCHGRIVAIRTSDTSFYIAPKNDVWFDVMFDRESVMTAFPLEARRADISEEALGGIEKYSLPYDRLENRIKSQEFDLSHGSLNEGGVVWCESEELPQEYIKINGIWLHRLKEYFEWYKLSKLGHLSTCAFIVGSSSSSIDPTVFWLNGAKSIIFSPPLCHTVTVFGGVLGNQKN